GAGDGDVQPSFPTDLAHRAEVAKELVFRIATERRAEDHDVPLVPLDILQVPDEEPDVLVAISARYLLRKTNAERLVAQALLLDQVFDQVLLRPVESHDSDRRTVALGEPEVSQQVHDLLGLVAIGAVLVSAADAAISDRRSVARTA